MGNFKPATWVNFTPASIPASPVWTVAIVDVNTGTASITCMDTWDHSKEAHIKSKSHQSISPSSVGVSTSSNGSSLRKSASKGRWSPSQQQWRREESKLRSLLAQHYNITGPFTLDAEAGTVTTPGDAPNAQAVE